MAYSETVSMVTGDTLPELNFSLKDSSSAAPGKRLDEYDSNTWAPLDVSDTNIVLRIRKVGSSTIAKTINCTLTDADNGKIKASFLGNSFSEPGTFEGELEITFPNDAGVQTVQDLIKIKVRSDFD